MICFIVDISENPWLELYRMIIEDLTHLITALWTHHQACCSGSDETNSWLYRESHSHDKTPSVHQQTFCSHSDEINSLHSSIIVSVKRDFPILTVWSFISSFSLFIRKTIHDMKFRLTLFYRNILYCRDKILHISKVN